MFHRQARVLGTTMWANAPSTFQADRRDALLGLLTKQADLPGAVFVLVPNMQDPEMSGIVGATKSLCGCGQRRLLLPGQGRSRFMSHVTPVRFPLAPGGELLVTPWGGDAAVSYVRISRPDISPDRVVCKWLHSSMAHQPQQNYWIDSLGRTARRTGEIVIMHEFDTGVQIPVCAIDVDADGQPVIEYDAATSLPEPQGAFHECGRAA